MTTVTFARYDIEVNMVSNVAKTLPILKEDGSVDQAAFAEYEEFLINVFAVLDEHEFEVYEEETGPKGETSYCLSACKKSESTDKNLRCIFSIRISGQFSPEDYEAAKLKRSFYTKQTWRLKDIVVNGEEFDSYDEALEGIGKQLTSLYSSG